MYVAYYSVNGKNNLHKFVSSSCGILKLSPKKGCYVDYEDRSADYPICCGKRYICRGDPRFDPKKFNDYWQNQIVGWGAKLLSSTPTSIVTWKIFFVCLKGNRKIVTILGHFWFVILQLGQYIFHFFFLYTSFTSRFILKKAGEYIGWMNMLKHRRKQQFERD